MVNEVQLAWRTGGAKEEREKGRKEKGEEEKKEDFEREKETTSKRQCLCMLETTISDCSIRESVFCKIST